MLTIRRVFMGVLALALTLTSSYAVDFDGAAIDVDEESSSSASHQRRELWDFFDLLMMGKFAHESKPNDRSRGGGTVLLLRRIKCCD